MRALLLWVLLGGLALAGFERYLDVRPRAGVVDTTPEESGQYQVMDGGNGMPPCCND